MKDVSNIPLVLQVRPTRSERWWRRPSHREGRTLNVIADVDSLPTMRKVAASGLAATILPICPYRASMKRNGRSRLASWNRRISRTLGPVLRGNQPFVGPTSLVARSHDLRDAPAGGERSLGRGGAHPSHKIFR